MLYTKIQNKKLVVKKEKKNPTASTQQQKHAHKW